MHHADGSAFRYAGHLPRIRESGQLVLCVESGMVRGLVIGNRPRLVRCVYGQTEDPGTLTGCRNRYGRGRRLGRQHDLHAFPEDQVVGCLGGLCGVRLGVRENKLDLLHGAVHFNAAGLIDLIYGVAVHLLGTITEGRQGASCRINNADCDRVV